MSSAMNILVITLCMNIMVALIGVNMSFSLGSNDLLNKFVTINNDTISPTDEFSIGGNNSAIPSDTSTAKGSIVPTANAFSFIDTIALTFQFIFMIIVGLFFPIYWGWALHLPIWLSLILLVQTIAGVASLIMIIRGVST